MRLVYPHSFEDANNRLETSYFHASRERNGECSRDIDAAIDGSCYERYRYNLDLAAMKVLHEYGFERVQAVLMHNIYTHEYDGRYSDSNKQWAQGFHLPEGAFQSAYMNAHPILLEDFTKRTRELYEELGAERFALPGREESGAIVRGYEITRSVFFDDRRGFAIGHNPDAPSPFVCWRFTTENGKRDFYWGTYAGDLKGAADNYTARVIVHLSGGDVKEIPNPPAAAEMTAEQNGNMIDGARNKEQPSEPTTAEREFAAWMAVTENSRHRWVEDDIYRLNGRGALYYTGGEDGTYIRIQSDGVLEAGTYEGAVPHIGEAMFRPAVEQRFNNFSDAMTAAMEAGGRRFLIDMFSAAEHLATEQAARRAYENPRGEKPSVLKRLREAQRAPKPPRKGKTPGKSRGDVEI
ncbi:MAG: DUF3849 domain-containing protein [Clostridiales Family XIII bacterium]|nr:DUF3849 domain-containing protein [Clostridiales Family XIII bacterium]